MRKYICLLVFCLVSICAMAQETRELKQVNLKSGIVLTGYVTNNTDGSISVTTVDGDQLWYSSAEVRSIDTSAEIEAQRKAEAKRDKRSDGGGSTMKEKGFQFSVEAFVGGGNDGIFGLEIAPSWRLNEHFLAGIGIGYMNDTYRTYYTSYDYYHDNYYYYDDYDQYNGLLLETFARYNILSKRITPFMELNLGVFDYECKFGLEAGCMFRNKRGGGPFVSLFFNLLDDDEIVGFKAGWTF